MGIFDLIKKQFVDVIDWTESEDGVLAYRFPMMDREIQNGGQLTVRESQVSIFVNEGEIADVFGPGLYTLTTQTLPVMTSLQNWDKLFQSPFKSDVYFFSTREQIDQKWGTASPITIRDKELGPVRLRANGTYSYKIQNPKVFYQKVSGTRETYTAAEMEGQLRSMILTSLASFMGKAEIPFLDMAANQDRFSQVTRDALAPSFDSYGLKLEKFLIQSLSLPEEVQARMDKAASMKVVGDLGKYAQYQAADSIPIAAANEGGMAGAGAGLGAGMAMGQMMASAIGQAAGGAGAGRKAEDPMATLEKLHGLLTKGVISQAEFDAKKEELLKKIS
jgi:membrane protease subunit (stomatin/prohibitin family)